MGQNDDTKNLATLISQKTITKGSEKIAKEKVMYEPPVGIDEAAVNSNELNKKSKSYVFLEQIRNHIDEGQLTWQDVRDEANVIVAAVSIYICL